MKILQIKYTQLQDMLNKSSLGYTFASIKTALNAFHIRHGGKLVDFAGYQLPVQYKPGILKQHLHCRSHASLFDVSHMGQISITGDKAVKLLERVTVGSTRRRSANNMLQCYLTLFLNNEGGIIDDAIAAVVNQGQVRMVVNGANKHIVMQHVKKINQKEDFKTNIQLHNEKSLIALQGPESWKVLQNLFTNVNFVQLPFMSQTLAKLNNEQYLISRSGYTGEDGFQISSQHHNIVNLAQKIMQNSSVALAGLGARDSLRLQAGLCLHGHDISEKTTPFQAGLMWTVYKKDDVNKNRLQFIGQKKLQEQVSQAKEKTIKVRKRIGFQVEGGGIVRQHSKIFVDGNQVGQTTSGTYGPSLKLGIGQAYVDQKYIKAETKLQAQYRGKRHPLIVKKMPFIPSNYYKGWA